MKQIINEKDVNILTNNNGARHREFINIFFNFQLKSSSTFSDTNINIIIKFKCFVKYFDFKIFIDDSKKEIERLNSKFDK